MEKETSMQFRQKKSRGQSLGLLVIYFVLAVAFFGAASKWIANLGVVPLFLFSAFLFAPAFLAFLNLLFVVTHVLETIGKLLYNRIFDSGINTNIFFLLTPKSFKPFFLPIKSPCVKGFFIFLMLIQSSNWAKSEDIVMGKGESLTLNSYPIRQFSIGNKEVLTYKFQEKSKSLIIRGSKLGNSEVLLWENGSEKPQKIQVFVISKIQESKILQISQAIYGLGLESEISLPQVRVKGILKDKTQYLTYKKLQKKHADILIDETSIDANLRKKLLSEVYYILLNDYKDQTKCSFSESNLNCFFPSNEKISESLKTKLEDSNGASFVEVSAQKLNQNYWYKIKIVQLEQLDGEEIKLGLEELNTTIKEILTLPINSIIEKNSILLNQKKVSISTLAEPSGVITPMVTSEFQVGAEVPFQTSSKDGVTTQIQWQFAGLKIKLNIENLGEQIKTNYETELTKPSGETNGSISGSKGKSAILANLNKPVILFQMSLKTDALGINQMPFINRIPIIGELFKSKSSQSNFKTITAILELKTSTDI